MIAVSSAMKNCLRIAKMFANTSSTILLRGEAGVGKKTLSRYIHGNSSRVSRPFVVLNVAARPSALIDAEILGYDRGAYTGANTSKVGVFQQADTGTLFIENIQDIPVDKQALILKYIETGEVLPLGSNISRKIDARIIASAQGDLESYVLQGRIREDLYYRLNVAPINIPPLRERIEDILPLAEYFIFRLGKIFGISEGDVSLTKSAQVALEEYTWPGNVRELRNVIERSLVTKSSSVIDDSTLELPSLRPSQQSPKSPEIKQALVAARAELEALRTNSIPASPIWEGRHFTIEYDLCFVLMPFSNISDVKKVYENYVRPVIESVRLRCVRADDIYDISGVMQSVWEGINRSRLVIAELTDRNPNVFYELGIAHTLGKPVIMITQSMDFVPFDLRHLRCIVYQYKPGRIEEFKRKLKNTIKTVLELRSGSLTYPS